MKLTKEALKQLIKEELNGLLEMDDVPTTFSNVYPGAMGKIFDMITGTERGEPSYYQTRIQILHLMDSLGEQFAKEMLEPLEVEIRNHHSYTLSKDQRYGHEVEEPRYKLMDLQYDIEQMLKKGYDAAYKELEEKVTGSENPDWLDI